MVGWDISAEASTTSDAANKVGISAGVSTTSDTKRMGC